MKFEGIDWDTLRARSTWIRSFIGSVLAGVLADAITKGSGAAVFFICLFATPIVVAVRSNNAGSGSSEFITRPSARSQSQYAVDFAQGWHEGVRPPLDVVAGESHYQAELRAIAGDPRPGGWVVPVGFVLEREPQNEFDANAIQVRVWGDEQAADLVGYLKADLAAQLAPLMDQSVERQIRLLGIVRGGWPEAPSFGVFLWVENPKSAALQALGADGLEDEQIGEDWAAPLEAEADAAELPGLTVTVSSTYHEPEPMSSRERKQYDAELAELRAATRARTALFELRVDQSVGPDPTETARSRGMEACPSCGTVIEGEVKSSRTCQHCKEKMVVRSKDGAKLLFTEAESEVVGARKKALADLRKAHGRVEHFGVTAEQFVEVLDGLGVGYSPRDASWRVLNERVTAALSGRRYSDASFLYSTMARQLSDEGKDFSDTLTKSAECEAKAEWLEAQEFGIETCDGLKISACSCAVCSTDNGRLIPWSEFSETPSGLSGPLPHLNCENGVCHCMYQLNFRR